MQWLMMWLGGLIIRHGRADDSTGADDDQIWPDIDQGRWVVLMVWRAGLMRGKGGDDDEDQWIDHG